MKYIGLLTLFLACFFIGKASEIDFQHYKKKFPNSETVTLNHNVDVEIFVNEETSELNATVVHDITMLALKNNGGGMGLVQVPFSAYEQVDILSAKYYLLDSLGVPKIKHRIKTRYVEEKDYFINGIFYNDLKVKQFASKTGVGEKSLLMYSYKETYTDVKFLTRVFAQSYVQNAVDSFNLSIRAPHYVDYELIPFNIQNCELNYSTEEVEGQEQRNYRITKIPTHVSEDLMAPSSYILPHLLFHIKSFEYLGKATKVLNSTEDLYAWYRSLIVELQPDQTFVDELSGRIVKSETDEEKKIKLLYEWMQKNVQYVAFEDGIAGFKPEEARSVCEKLYGDCKGMANLLVELLNSQGFTAYHTWIGTRSLPYDYSIPSLAVDNHMICALEWQGKTYFLDPTDKSSQWNVASSHIQGKTALVGIGDNFKLLKVPVTPSEKNKVSIQAVISVGESPFSDVVGSIELDGLVRNKYSNYIKYASVRSKALVIQSLVRHYFDDFIVAEKDVSVVDDGFVMLIKFKGKLAGLHTLTANELDVYPNLGMELKEFLKQDSIDYPLYVKNRFELNYNLTYKYSSGFKPSKLPSPVSLNFNNGVSYFKSKYQANGAMVNYSSSLVLNKELIKLEELSGWDNYVLNLRSAVYQPLILLK